MSLPTSQDITSVPGTEQNGLMARDRLMDPGVDNFMSRSNISLHSDDATMDKIKQVRARYLSMRENTRYPSQNKKILKAAYAPSNSQVKKAMQKADHRDSISLALLVCRRSVL